MRALVCAASIATLVGLFVVPKSATALPPGCVDLLVDCNPTSTSMTTVCDVALHDLTQIPWDSKTVAKELSYVVFGANVKSVTLTQCGTGKTLVITQDTDLCNVPGWNDNVCDLEALYKLAPAPALGGWQLALVALLLVGAGWFLVRRRTA
jgi:hypothetical protein